MRRKYVGLLAWGCCAIVGAAPGCASAPADHAPASSAALAESSAAPSGPPRRPGDVQIKLGDEPDDAVGVAFDRGYLNQNDINDAIARHTGRLTACYERAGGAQRFAGGKVKLRFLVGPDGVVKDVLVIDTEIGNYPVERCLVVEGRKIPFPRPGGAAGADFEYGLEFQSSRQVHVVDWQKDVLRRSVGARLPVLDRRCGSPGEKAVAAVAYINPRGSVVSVGLASDGKLDTMAAMCVVEEIHKWRFAPRRDKGQLVRTILPLGRGRGSATLARLRRPQP